MYPIRCFLLKRSSVVGFRDKLERTLYIQGHTYRPASDGFAIQPTSPQQPYSHDGHLNSCHTQRGKIFYLGDWHFPLEINYTIAKCCRHFGALILCPDPLYLSPLSKRLTFLDPITFFLFIEVVFNCRTGSIKF